MFNKFLIVLFVFISFHIHLEANEKQLIIDRLMDIDNFTFDFEQTINKKVESGTCVIVFNNKLKCNYNNSAGKEVLINGNKLVVNQKRYNKTYFYPISNSLFVKILNKDSLVSLIQKSNYKLSKNIELLYVDENEKKNFIFFDKQNYNLIGWKIADQLQNVVNFSLNIKYINSELDNAIFKIPAVD